MQRPIGFKRGNYGLNCSNPRCDHPVWSWRCRSKSSVTKTATDCSKGEASRYRRSMPTRLAWSGKMLSTGLSKVAPHALGIHNLALYQLSPLIPRFPQWAWWPPHTMLWRCCYSVTRCIVTQASSLYCLWSCGQRIVWLPTRQTQMARLQTQCSWWRFGSAKVWLHPASAASSGLFEWCPEMSDWQEKGKYGSG